MGVISSIDLFCYSPSIFIVYKVLVRKTERGRLLIRPRLGREDNIKTKLKLNSVALVRERTVPTERPPLVVPTFADRGCRVVSATDSNGR
jgi:hypothetical protein